MSKIIDLYNQVGLVSIGKEIRNHPSILSGKVAERRCSFIENNLKNCPSAPSGKSKKPEGCFYNEH